MHTVAPMACKWAPERSREISPAIPRSRGLCPEIAGSVARDRASSISRTKCAGRLCLGAACAEILITRALFIHATLLFAPARVPHGGDAAATARTAALARHLHDECNRAVDKYWAKPNKKGDVFCIFDDASDDETVAAR